MYIFLILLAEYSEYYGGSLVLRSERQQTQEEVALLLHHFKYQTGNTENNHENFMFYFVLSLTFGIFVTKSKKEYEARGDL